MCAHAGLPRRLPAECGVSGSSRSAIGSEGLNDIILEKGTYLGEVSQGLTLATWVVAGPKGTLGGTEWLKGTDNFGNCLGSRHGFTTYSCVPLGKSPTLSVPVSLTA